MAQSRVRAARAAKTSTRSRLRRDRERAETRERILEAAREMFVRDGYEATTMRAIADQLDYTATAIYHHFRSKEELMLELATTDFRSLAGAFSQIGRIEDPIERLRRVWEDALAGALVRPEYQDAEELAQMCWSSLHGLLSLHLVKHNATQQGEQWIAWRDARQTARRLSEALVRGLTR